MLKVAHLTSAHPRNDIRIFLKQCQSLANFGYQVNLIVADGKGDEVVKKINIFDVGAPSNRLNRMFNAPKRVYKKAIKLDADIYHLHDPELLSIGLKLKRKGKKVIFDAHEDLPKQILTKPYLNPTAAKIISIIMKYYEQYACSKFNAVVTATPTIRDKFLEFCFKVVDINNYPLLGELTPIQKDWIHIQNEIVYVGGISKIRGIEQVIKAFSMLETSTKLNLVGTCNNKSTYNSIKVKDGWRSVNEFGQLDRSQVKEILKRSVAGLVTFLPAPNHTNAQPNKMFEYMSAGIPVISSNYPLWKSIVEDNNCGICVDPERPQEIAAAIDMLINNKDLAKEMGSNGIQAVNNKYNWSVEESKLFKLYKDLLSN